MFIRTLLLLQDEEDEDIFKSYIEALYKCEVKTREIILKSFHCPKEGEAFDPYSIPFNKNFIKNLYRCSFEMGKELFEAYPQFGIIGTSTVPLRTVAKKFDSLEEAYFRYGKSIKWNEERHSQIIKLVRWAKDNNIINCSLASFIINQGWIDLEALKEMALMLILMQLS